MSEYAEYLYRKAQIGGMHGFDPTFIPSSGFAFQNHLIEWAVRKGRGATFADCGLGKSLIELSFAQNIVERTNGKVLLLTPIAVGSQMEDEAEKFGIEAKQSRDGKIKAGITITNYEQLGKFAPSDFEGIICDESSILKNFDGKTKALVTQFSRKLKYRLLATATAAPNDFVELGTSSEALGYLGYMDMLAKFFKNDQNNAATNRRGRFTEETKWRLKGHAHKAFWRWVVSWSRAIRKPSDIGFSDDGYDLPALNIHEHEISGPAPDEMLFSVPAVGLKEQRDERRGSITERCEAAAQLAMAIDDFSVVWCNLNDEGDLLAKLIPGAVQVSGKDSDEAKEEKLTAFSHGEFQKLIIKPKIGGMGLNWQHCNHTVFFPTHSYEQFYQSIRRFWRFGQRREVNVDMVYTYGDTNMVANLKRKERQADEMFNNLVAHMNNALHVSGAREFTTPTEVPSWL